MMISQSVQASPEVLRQYMAERVPLDKRIEGVYIPTILTDNVCYLMTYVKMLCKDKKIKSISHIIKRFNRISDRYYSQNIQAMHAGLYNRVRQCSGDFYQECIQKHLVVDQFTYAEELWRQRPEYQGNVVTILGAVYFTRMVLGYIIRYERDWSKEIQNYLGEDIRYVAHDNDTCVAILKCLDDILTFYKAPEHLDSYNIQLSYKIFKNKVSRIDVTSVLNDKTNGQ